MGCARNWTGNLSVATMMILAGRGLHYKDNDILERLVWGKGMKLRADIEQSWAILEGFHLTSRILRMCVRTELFTLRNLSSTPIFLQQLQW